MARPDGRRSDLTVAEGALVALVICAGLLSLGWVTVLIWAVVATCVFVDARRVGRAPIVSALATFFLPGFGLAFYVRDRLAARRLGGPDRANLSMRQP